MMNLTQIEEENNVVENFDDFDEDTVESEALMMTWLLDVTSKTVFLMSKETATKLLVISLSLVKMK